MTTTTTVLDIHLASYLLLHEIEPVLEKGQDGRVRFLYDPTERFFELQDAFNRDTALQRFVSCLKQTRGWMLDARSNGNGRGYGEANGNRR